MRTANNILVTGGLGFIGSAFIRYLFRDEGWSGSITNLDSVTYAANPANLDGIADSKRYALERGSITDLEFVRRVLEEHQIDTIVNFAAESHVDRSILAPREFIDTNFVGTFTLLEAVRERPEVHFHHVSTDEVYGSLGPTGLFVEDTAYDPQSPYSASKAAADHLVRAYANTYKISTTISNCSNNYGPCQFPEKLIPLMILNCLEGKPLPVYGDGSNIRDWLYVDDHAEAIWQVVREGKTGASYNVGGDCELKNIDLLHQLIEVVAQETEQSAETLRALITFVKDRPGHDHRYAIDFSKIQGELGWKPRHDFASGLHATVRWYLDNPQWVEGVRSGAYRQWLDANYGDRA